jgi:uncharacterized cupin superfamily protein
MEVIVKKMDKKEVESKGINSWPIWEKEVSEFDWYYSEKERCYFIEGEVEVTDSDGNKYKIKKGDYVEFPEGLSCKWKVIKPVKKYYNFG